MTLLQFIIFYSIITYLVYIGILIKLFISCEIKEFNTKDRLGLTFLLMIAPIYIPVLLGIRIITETDNF